MTNTRGPAMVSRAPPGRMAQGRPPVGLWLPLALLAVGVLLAASSTTLPWWQLQGSIPSGDGGSPVNVVVQFFPGSVYRVTCTYPSLSSTGPPVCPNETAEGPQDIQAIAYQHRVTR